MGARDWHVWLALLAACGGRVVGTTDSGADAADAWSFDARDAVAATDAADAADAAEDVFPVSDAFTDDVPADAPPPTLFGAVGVLAQDSTRTTSAVAYFRDVSTWGTPEARYGGCAYFPQGRNTSRNAGTITVAGGRTPLTLTPRGTAPNLVYEASPQLPYGWVAPGATLTITATGDEVPSFRASVVAAAPIRFTAPTDFSRSVATTVTWAPANAGFVRVTLVIFGSTTNYHVACETDDDGSFAVPPQVVAAIPPDGERGLVVVFRFNRRRLRAGHIQVDLESGGSNSAIARVVP